MKLTPANRQELTSATITQALGLIAEENRTPANPNQALDDPNLITVTNLELGFIGNGNKKILLKDATPP